MQAHSLCARVRNFAILTVDNSEGQIIKLEDSVKNQCLLYTTPLVCIATKYKTVLAMHGSISTDSL